MTQIMESLFKGNRGILSETELEKVSQTRILLVGLGGLGGHLVNSLARLGVRSLMLVDYDRFSPTNLNRQLFSSTETLGKYKADVRVYDSALVFISQLLQREFEWRVVQAHAEFF